LILFIPLGIHRFLLVFTGVYHGKISSFVAPPHLEPAEVHSDDLEEVAAGLDEVATTGVS